MYQTFLFIFLDIFIKTIGFNENYKAICIRLTQFALLAWIVLFFYAVMVKFLHFNFAWLYCIIYCNLYFVLYHDCSYITSYMLTNYKIHCNIYCTNHFDFYYHCLYIALHITALLYIYIHIYIYIYIYIYICFFLWIFYLYIEAGTKLTLKCVISHSSISASSFFVDFY